LSALVVDASVALAWCLGDEADEEAEDVLRAVASGGASVPQHWSLEVASGLLAAERRGRIAPAELPRVVALLEALPIETDDGTSGRALHEIATLAQSHGLTTYDAGYLDLAIRLGAQLASLDEDLRRAAAEVGVGLRA
jgi:predicted nucleic acid-binding protein